MRSRPTITIGALLFAACSGGGDEAERTSIATEKPAVYVAATRTADGALSVAIVVDGDRIAAYTCGDDPMHDRYPGWLFGRSNGDHVTLAHDGWALEAAWTYDAGSVAGTLVEPDGVRVPWSGARVQDGSRFAGLYAAHDSGCVTGIVVVGDVVRGTWCDAEGRVAQVTPVVPIELVDGRLLVDVVLAAGERRLLAGPVRTAEP